MKKFGLDILTAKLAIGSLWIVSIFLLVDRLVDLLPLIEEITATQTWSVLVSIPLLVFSYLLGAIVIFLSSYRFLRKDMKNDDEISDFVSLCKIGNAFVLEKYETLKNELDFFQAAIPTLVILSIAVFWESTKLVTAKENAVKFLSILTFLLTFILYSVVKRLRRQIRNLITNSIINEKNN